MSRKNALFNEVPQQKVNRNLFDLSHEVKMSGKFGLLYPILLMDAVPGDVIRDQMTAFMRFAPMLAPIMHRIDVTTHFFFVPNRILSNHWEDFITGGQDGLSEVILPYITPVGIRQASATNAPMLKSTLWDYFGLPTFEGAAPVAADMSQQHISALPFYAYAKIWNDWYMDPNLDTEINIDMETQGNVTGSMFGFGMFNLRNRMWEKDYFTSALPWAQRGAEVLMPLGGTASVTYSDTTSLVSDTNSALGPVEAGAYLSGTIRRLEDTGGLPLQLQNIDSVDIDSSNITINDLRRSLAIQRWLENNARGGGRYIDQIKSHFNVTVPDYRLQRAEYLGGGKQPVTISQVLATAESDNIPVGDMAGHGVSVGKSNRFTYQCQEHGWVIGILSVVPRTAYSQGIDKMWFRENKYDHAFPELANLGEQEIKSKEVFYSFLDVDAEDNDSVFGYIPRYAEYKFKNDRIAGDFRDNLNFWHLGRFFVERPVLEPTFTTMYENLTTQEETSRRIFAVQDGTDYLWMQLYHKLTAKRPLPYFGVPQIM